MNRFGELIKQRELGVSLTISFDILHKSRFILNPSIVFAQHMFSMISEHDAALRAPQI